MKRKKYTIKQMQVSSIRNDDNTYKNPPIPEKVKIGCDVYTAIDLLTKVGYRVEYYDIDDPYWNNCFNSIFIYRKISLQTDNDIVVNIILG